MEAFPASATAEIMNEVWKSVDLHARVEHNENSAEWDDATREYLDTLIEPVSV